MSSIDRLFALTEQMAEEGVSLIPRVVSGDAPFTQWTHYPSGDAISPKTKSRWFYHAHPPEQRAEGEHGHFHIFLPLDMFKGIKPLAEPNPDAFPSGKKRAKLPAKVVHIGALAFDTDGMPSYWFTANRWVTDEYLLPADAIIKRLHRFNVDDASGDAIVNQWITAAVESFPETIADLLLKRDTVLADQDYEDTAVEITARADFDF